MKKYDYKRVLKNILILFVSFFILWLVISLYVDFSHSVSFNFGSVETNDTIFWDMKTSLFFSLMQSLVYIPLLVLAGLIKMKERNKIILAFVITIIATLVYLMMNFSIY